MREVIWQHLRASAFDPGGRNMNLLGNIAAIIVLAWGSIMLLGTEFKGMKRR